MLKPLWVAVQFMTRLPVPRVWLPEDYDAKLMGQSVLAYPVVGFIIGLLLWGITFVSTGLPSLVVAALLLAVWVLVTGALHLDGLADCADAWVGGHGDSERTLAMMKDSFIGPVGVAAVVCLLLLKFAALTALTQTTLALILTPVLARAAIIVLFLTTPYVRAQGLGQHQSQQLPTKQGYAVLSLLAFGCVFLLGWHGIGMLICLAAVFIFLRWQFVKTIGGMTGDTAGAMLEMMEALLLIIFAGIF